MAAQHSSRSGISRRIRALRRRRRLSRDALAAMIGLSGADIAEIESGGTRLPLDTLVRLLAALEVTPDDLVACDTPSA